MIGPRVFLYVTGASLVILVSCFTLYPANASENEDVAVSEELEEQDEHLHLGEHKHSDDHMHSDDAVVHGPEGSYYFGYRWASDDEIPKAIEYQYPHSSMTFGIDALAADLPHRYHLNAEFLNKKDFYGDTGYAYSDLVLFQDVFVGLRHNFGHFDYQLPAVPPAIRYDDRNAEDKYFVDYFNNMLSLRLKAPDFPFHAFFQNRYVARDGAVEERFMLGDFTNLVKTSATRDIDWNSSETTIGANSHLGPVEIEYAHNFSQFDPGKDNVLYDYYPQSFVFGRPADVYPHNVTPETESSGNHLRLHSSYTGQIVASASLCNLYQTNNYSNAESTTWRGTFDLRWLPDPVLGLFFKYRHKDMDTDNPDYVSLSGLTSTNFYQVRKSLSYSKDAFSLSSRYRPNTWLTLLGGYEFEHLERKDVDEWEVLPEEGNIHNLSLKAHGRPFSTLKLKALYDYTYNDNPSYNTDPDSSNQFRLAATYTPIPLVTLYADYAITVSEREDLRYLNSLPAFVVEGGERDGRTDHFLASCSFLFTPKSTLTASWAYNRWKVEQDLLYATAQGGIYGDDSVPYTDTSNTFSLAFQYLPRDDITVTADISHTISEGEYEPGNSLNEPFGSITAFSYLETSETIFTLGLDRRFSHDWEIGLKLYADIYDDKANDLEDGQFYTATLLVKRYF